MRTTFSVYAPSTSRWITPLHEALKAANGLQSKFKYELVSLTDELETKRSTLNVRKLDRKLAEHHVRGLVICDQAFKDGLVVVELLPERVYVTTQIPRKGPAPPAVPYVSVGRSHTLPYVGVGARTKPEDDPRPARRLPVGLVGECEAADRCDVGSANLPIVPADAVIAI